MKPPGEGCEETLPLPTSEVAAAVPDATLPLPASGDATLPLPAGGVTPEATLAAGSVPGKTAPVVIRAGGKDDYRELVAIDPRHYVVGDEIARGGMGRIMVARDRRLGRPVAIKELLNDSSDIRLRFDREVRITAKLQHPAIVNLLEAGQWPSGEPFYAMKLVTGESLDKVILERPTLEARLGLLPNVIAVVDALAFAHSKHVIHRDLKPANVLVGEFGETVVIDWGLAKDITDLDDAVVISKPARPGETMIGSVMGTPAYMPPEQAVGGIVDERADVYALGAMLYHVLAGTPPFTGKTTDEVLAKVKRDSAVPLELVAPGVPVDLVTIVSKAMARPPADRYPSARELADDLKRFQTGQLVGAHRYSTWQLVRRWVRRHRTSITIAGIAMTLLIGLAIASVRGIVHEQARTEEQRQSAEQNRAKAEELMSFMLVDLRDKLAPLGKLPLLDAVATKAVEYYEGRPEALDDGELNQRAIALSNLGNVLLQQNDVAGALARHQASLAIHQQMLARDPSSPNRLNNVASAHGSVGNVFRTQGKLDEALQQYRTAYVLAEQLAAREPTPQRRRDVSVGHERLGFVLSAQGDLKGALEHLAQSRAILEKLLERDAANVDLQHGLWTVRGSIGDVRLRQRNIPASFGEYQAALAIAERLVAADPKNTRSLRNLSVSNDRIAEILQLTGDASGALERFRAGLVVAQALTDRDPSNAQWQRDLAVSHGTIAGLLVAKDDDAHALEEYRAALRIMTRLAALDPDNGDWQQDLGYHNISIGEVLRKQQDGKAALEAYRAGVALLEKVVAKAPRNAVALRLLYYGLGQVGVVFEDRKDMAGALGPYRASLEVAKRLVTLDPTGTRPQDDLAYGYESLGDAQHATGDHAAALATYRSIVPIRDALVAKEPTNTEFHDSLAIVRRKLGDVLLAQRNPAEAIVELRAALAIKQRLATADASNAALAAEVAKLKTKVATCCNTR